MTRPAAGVLLTFLLRLTKQAHTIISVDTLQAFMRVKGVSSGQLGQLSVTFVDRWRRRHHKGSGKNLYACTAHLLLARAQIHSLDCADALQHFLILSSDSSCAADWRADQQYSASAAVMKLSPSTVVLMRRPIQQLTHRTAICQPPARATKMRCVSAAAMTQPTNHNQTYFQLHCHHESIVD